MTFISLSYVLVSFKQVALLAFSRRDWPVTQHSSMGVLHLLVLEL